MVPHLSRCHDQDKTLKYTDWSKKKKNVIEYSQMYSIYISIPNLSAEINSRAVDLLSLSLLL